jgi:hypothetical protein
VLRAAATSDSVSKFWISLPRSVTFAVLGDVSKTLSPLLLSPGKPKQ